MSKEVVITTVSWCDYPGCRDIAEEETPEGQETQAVSFWFYVHGKGRKTNPIQVDLCEEHSEEQRALLVHMSKYHQREQ